MKFAIDKRFDKGLINGWATSDKQDLDIEFSVNIFTPQRKVFSAKANLYRSDVQSAGLHSTGNCGFSFNAHAAGVRDGDLIFIRIGCEEPVEFKSHSFVYGDANNKVEEFSKYELARDDFSIMEESTIALLENHNHLLALKILMIRLRRFKRAKQWRGEFYGIEYSYKETDWELFRNIVTNYREAIFDNLSTRYLFSIIDTIADFSSKDEGLAALSLSMMMFHERFAYTLNLIYDKQVKINPVKNTQMHIWGDMLTNNLFRDDSLDIYLTRSTALLKEYPALLSYFYEIVQRSAVEQNSLFHENISSSEYFMSAWEFYSARFSSEKRLMLSSIKYSLC